MAGRRAAVTASMGQLFGSGPISGLDDGELLDRFASVRDEAAFAALVALHGPMVLNVCRRMLRDSYEAEDAFQATFLVLARRAGSIRDPGRLGPWLHGVARRVAMRARAQAARRAHRGLSGSSGLVDEAAIGPVSRPEDAELAGLIDEEMARLPSRYREAVILCDLEGRPYAEAARRLGCPLGTLQSRLARGRERLRARLVGRGATPMALTTILAGSTRAAVPHVLAGATIRAAAAGVVTGSAASLAAPVARALVMTTIQTMTAAMILVAIVIGGGSVARDGLSAGPMEFPPPAAAVPPAPQPAEPDRPLDLTVLDGDTQEPLAGATVRVRVNWSRPLYTLSTTEQGGRCKLVLPGGLLSLVQIVVSHSGFAPAEVDWRPGQSVPASYTVTLERGSAIGGVVRDQQGRPVAGAEIRLWTPFTRWANARNQFPLIDSEFVAAITDEQGRWRSEALPASAAPGERLFLDAIHADHMTLRQESTAEALRSMATVGVLKTGRAVSGSVTSPTGRPVVGATVTVQSRSDRSLARRVETDRDGRFRTGPFVDPEWREFTMVIRADGFASSTQTLLVPAEIAPQAIRLAPRRPLRGRLVDAKGHPVPGAIVLAPREYGFGGLEWEAVSDADGRFIWYEAPATGNYSLDVKKESFRPIVALNVAGGTEELTIVLHRSQRVHGTVTDAETGRPIERFNVIKTLGPIRPGMTPQWHDRFFTSSQSFGDGRFDLTETYPDQNTYHSIRVEAEGYESAELIGYHDSQEDVAHDFKLRRAATLAGTVRGPDGRPMGGVDVVLREVVSGVSIRNGRLEPGRRLERAPRVQTGSDGRYTLHLRGRRAWIIAIHDEGIALRSADEAAGSPDLTLERWGRVEGLVKIGQEPASGATVRGWSVTPGLSVNVDYEATTLASGRFVLDRVVPGRMVLSRRVDNADRQGWTFSNQVAVDVKPGETVRMPVGGTGRPVVGRLVVPRGFTLSQFALGHGRLAVPVQEPRTPDDFLDLDDDRRSAWREAVSRTPEGRSSIEDRFRWFAVALRPDGSFRAEDVPAGHYELELPFEGVSRGSRDGWQALARVRVTVPEIPGGRSDEPLDIGTVPLEVFPFHEPGVGEPAPTIAAKLPDGRPLDLAALRGRFVLLHFWSARTGSAANLGHVKAAHDAFGRDPRLVFVGLFGGESAEPMRRYAAHQGLAWEHRYIGPTDPPNPFTAAFGVWFPPAAFLIGPDGRIVARDLEGEAIRQAVARALRPGD